ncbi:hypothetical protein HWV62_37165 [Athelia sp. TMB]|nr:hypothetical protein HWV62_37165 [Athelia sp. TMB]
MSSAISTPWGLILIGVFISLILFGIIVFTYFQNCDKDPLWQKLFVGTIFLLDTLSSVLAMAWMYYLLIDNWGQIEAFTFGDWLLAADPMVAGVIAFMVQLFFAWRIHIVAKTVWLTLAIVICAFLTLCGGLGTGIAVLWVKEYALFANFQQIATIWLISASMGDIGITISLTHHLRRRKGTFRATDRLLDRIIQLLSSLNARRSMRRDASATVDGGSRSTSTGGGFNVVKLNPSQTHPSPEVFAESHEMSDAKGRTGSVSESEHMHGIGYSSTTTQ